MKRISGHGKTDYEEQGPLLEVQAQDFHCSNLLALFISRVAWRPQEAQAEPTGTQKP